MLFDDEVISYISSLHLKETVLDVFYIIFQREEGIAKIDILREYQKYAGIDPGKSSQASRLKIDEAINILLGTTFVSYYKEGTSQKYFLTKNGEKAAELLSVRLDQDPDLLKASKVVSKVMQEG